MNPQIANGMTAHGVAMSIAVGMYGGVFPIWGTQSLACMALGVPLGANMVIYVAGESQNDYHSKLNL